MKKIFVMLLVFLFSLQSFAGAIGPNSLKDIIDELKYELSQAQGATEMQDISFRYSTLLGDMLENSSTQEKAVLIEALLSQVNPQAASDYKKLLGMVDVEKMSQQQQIDMLGTLLKNHGYQGASWDGGEDLAYIPVGILMVAFMLNGFSCGALFDVLFGWKWWKNGCA